MAQAKGVLPTKGDDREVLYKNPRTCGYFIGVRLVAGLSTEQLREWLAGASAAVDVLVAREQPKAGQAKGDKVASVAVGFAPRFFERINSAGTVLESPVGFRSDLQPTNGLVPGTQSLDVDAMFYVASVYETRVNEFLSTIAALQHVETLSLERGYQTSDETEPFGYKDGERNVRRSERSRVVYVHTDGDQPDEPDWAEGGTYMVTMKIIQKPEAFLALSDDAARDNVIGRTKDGIRLDLQGQDIRAHDEPTAVPDALPANSHVRKAGPRGVHDDIQIFRRGLPFMEVSNGCLQVGLHSCSFQANPAQFDTVFNDWMMNPQFPARSDGSTPGADALLAGSGPAGQYIQVVSAGLFFVPPYHKDGLAAALSGSTGRGKPTHGRLVVSKRVEDPANPGRRFERGGFVFRVQEQDGPAVPGAEFTTNSAGRGICPVKLEIGKAYVLVEVSSPHPSTDALAQIPFTMEKPNENLRVTNQLTQPGGYGTR